MTNSPRPWCRSIEGWDTKQMLPDIGDRLWHCNICLSQFQNQKVGGRGMCSNILRETVSKVKTDISLAEQNKSTPSNTVVKLEDIRNKGKLLQVARQRSKYQAQRNNRQTCCRTFHQLSQMQATSSKWGGGVKINLEY